MDPSALQAVEACVLSGSALTITFLCSKQLAACYCRERLSCMTWGHGKDQHSPSLFRSSVTRFEALAVLLFSCSTCVSTLDRNVELTTAPRSATSCGMFPVVAVDARLLNCTKILEFELGSSLVAVVWTRLGLDVLVCRLVCSVEMFACRSNHNYNKWPLQRCYCLWNARTDRSKP